MKKRYEFTIITSIIFSLSFLLVLTAVHADTHYQGIPISIFSSFTSNTCDSLKDIANLPGVKCGERNPFDIIEIYTLADIGYESGEFIDYEGPGHEALLAKYIAINFYDESKIVSKNYVMNQNDKICVGESLKLDSIEPSGEWFEKGGPIGSPPITWVSKEELKEIVSKYIDYYKTHKELVTPTESYYNFLKEWYMSDPVIYSVEGPTYIYTNQKNSTDEILGKTIPLYTAPFFHGYSAVICASNNIFLSSGESSFSSFKITKSGKMEFEIKSEPVCVFYTEFYSKIPATYGTLYKLSSFQKDGVTDAGRSYFISGRLKNPLLIDLTNPNWIDNLTITSLSTKFTLQALETTEEPNLKIDDYSIQGKNIRFLIRNSGDIEAKLDAIDSNIPLELLKNTKVPPGQTVEVFAKLQDVPQTEKLNFNLVYRTDELGCLKTKEYGVKIGFIGCKYNSECSSVMNSICCEGSCKDSREGVCRDENGDGLMEWILFG